MRFIIRPLQYLYVIYAFLVFVILMIFVFIWSLLVLPFGRIRSGNLIYYGCMAWADIWFLLVCIRHRNIYLEPLDKGKACIFVSNHISYLDSAIIPRTFRQPVRPLGKVEMAKIPIFGFIYKNAIVTVDRSSPAQRTKSVQVLKSLVKKGISILVFPEGTFNTTHRPMKEFYDGAFRIAIETGTPIRPVILLDAYARMHYKSIFSMNPGRSRAIFLPAIPVEEFDLNDVSLLRDKVHRIMSEAAIEYGASWIDENAKFKSENEKLA